MKCEECQMLMEEQVDGLLDQKGAGLVDSHIASCKQCAAVYAELAREQEIYARYQRDVEATPLLWNSIAARIEQERAARPAGLLSRLSARLTGLFAAPMLSPGLAAALVVIAIGVTVGVMTYLNSRGPGSQIAQGNGNTPMQEAGGDKESGAAAQPSASITTGAPKIAKNQVNQGSETVSIGKPGKASAGPKKPTPDQLVREAEQKYLAAIAMLSRDVNRHRSQIDPIMLARFDAALGDIDRTIQETRRVVRENPGDPIALQYLLAAYSKKVDVLREMTLTEN